MMRSLYVLIGFILIRVTLFAQGINFENGLSWQQVLEKAKQENKYIFIDAHATWCVPCKQMDKDVYSDRNVGKAFSEKFISVKVQMDSTKDDTDEVRDWYSIARNLAEDYQIRSLPTYLVFSPGGTAVHKGVGYKQPSELLIFAATALDSAKQYYTILNKYKNNSKDSALAMYAARRARTAGDKELAFSIASKYIKGLESKDIFQMNNLAFIQEFTLKTTDPGFSILYRNIEKVNDLVGADAAESVITAAITNDMITPYIKNGEKPDWNSISKRVVSKYGKLGKETVLQTQLFYAVNTKNDSLFLNILKPWYDIGGPNRRYIGSMNVNNFAWRVFEKSDDMQKLKLALVMSEFAITLQTEDVIPTFYDTKANILYKLGKKEEAIACEEKALLLAIGKNDELSIKEFGGNLDKMEKGLPTWPVK